MRTLHAVGLLLATVILVVLSPPASAQGDADAADLDRAVATFTHGDTKTALAQVEAILTRSPENQNALYDSALFNYQLNNIDAARGRLERVVNLAGNYSAAWELMVQVTQAQGDVDRRDEAIGRLKISIATAIDPEIRERTEFIRDRILVADRAVYAADYFTRSGSDFTRYQWALGDPRMDQEHGILLRTDAATTENWSGTALLPPEKQLFHLDMVDPRPEGGDRVAIYAYYVGEPDYDSVRATVVQILRGDAKPLSGDPGSLSGIQKP